MSKGLEALKEVIQSIVDELISDEEDKARLLFAFQNTREFITVETELKLLELIKDQVNIEVREIQGTYYLMVGGSMKNAKPITKEEYDLLNKEGQDDQYK